MLDVLAEGGMGKVYRARVVGAAGFEKTVALKFMLPKRAGDADAIRMFQDEARLAASLSHANIVGILDFGVRGGNWYLAMEYVAGANLRVLLERAKEKKAPLPPLLAAFIAAEVARGLHYAHSLPGPDGRPMGIVHRDVSPQNVVVSWNGEVKILDFGIALARNRSDDGSVVRGKFSYMSPEQALGEPIDFRSDLFALGSLLYEMLTGEKAFPQPGMKAALAVSQCEFERPDRVRRDLPVKLVSVVLRAMARDPFDRPLSAGEMLNELTQWIAEQRARGSREDEHAMLARWASDVCEEAPGAAAARRDFTWSDDALSDDSTKSGEDEWRPPARTALLGPAARAARSDSGANRAAPAPESPRVPGRAMLAGAATLALGAALSAAVLSTRGRHAPPAPTPTPAASSIAVATAPSRPAATVAGTARAITLAAASPSPSATPAVRHVGLLEVTSVPAGAHVRLDGQDVGDAPALLPDLAVPHRYAVEVTRDGFAPWGREVDLADDVRVELVARLLPHSDDLGHASFDIPDGLEVVLDGKSIGRGPTTVTVDAEPGPHQVHLHDRTGKLVKDFTLELRANETAMPSLPGG